MKMRSPICWPVASFQEVADGVTGTTPSTKKDEYYGGSIPFVGPSDLGFASPITEATKWLSKEGGEVSRLLPPESVLVCCIGATIGKVGFAGTTLSTNQQINALVFDKSQVFPRYGFYYCQTLRKLIRHQGASTTLPLLPKSRFQKIKIPLPPIAEQRRIAAILDKADGIRRDRKQAIQYTEELLRSAFLDMFGEPTNNPKGWDVAELGDLLIDIDSGWSPKCEKHAADTEEWGVLKLGSVSYGYFESHENKAMLPENAPRTELEVRKGDLLFSRKNTYELVGASAFVEDTRPKLMLPDLIFRLRVKTEIDPVYLWQALSRKSMRSQLSGLAGGSSGSMPNISKARLRTLKLPVPPKSIQEKYRRIVDLFWLAKEHQSKTHKTSETLFNSLLQRAFKGEL